MEATILAENFSFGAIASLTRLVLDILSKIHPLNVNYACYNKLRQGLRLNWHGYA